MIIDLAGERASRGLDGRHDTSSLKCPKAIDVRCADGRVDVTLDNGLVISFPVEVAPRLMLAGRHSAAMVKITGNGHRLRWLALNFEVSLPVLLESIGTNRRAGCVIRRAVAGDVARATV